ncbi:hypothetical protein C1646_762070 [Rhizophagus diaphanus]|nr:hypothetical protein C1646_762070 [Rhizophagus diaphanus] [Rhizophagus sp. MUCL 43196]
MATDESVIQKTYKYTILGDLEDLFGWKESSFIDYHSENPVFANYTQRLSDEKPVVHVRQSCYYHIKFGYMMCFDLDKTSNILTWDYD